MMSLGVAMLPAEAIAGYLPRDELADADLDPAERVLLLCDAKSGRLHVRAVGDHDDDDRTYPTRTLVQVADLVGMSQGQYRRFKSMSYRCGRYRIRFSGDALNPNIQGELGAEPAFLSVAITRGKNVILPSTRLTICQSGEQSSRWGRCPDDYATRVSVLHGAGVSMVSVSSGRISDGPDAEMVTKVRCTKVPDAHVIASVAC
jgi:hypothetical protein